MRLSCFCVAKYNRISVLQLGLVCEVLELQEVACIQPLNRAPVTGS